VSTKDVEIPAPGKNRRCTGTGAWLVTLIKRKDSSSHEEKSPISDHHSVFRWPLLECRLGDGTGLGAHGHQPEQPRRFSRCGGGLQAAVRQRSADSGLKAVFDATLYSDLGNAGIFDLVSKSLAPQAMPGSPQEIVLSQWVGCAGRRGNGGVWGGFRRRMGGWRLYGWLFDARNTANPQVLGKQYNEAASEDMARTWRNRFADEIIYRLGGGINELLRPGSTL